MTVTLVRELLLLNVGGGILCRVFGVTPEVRGMLDGVFHSISKINYLIITQTINSKNITNSIDDLEVRI